MAAAADDRTTFNSKVEPLADYVNSHPNITVDVGQVLFGKTTSMTGDGPLGLLPEQSVQDPLVQPRRGVRIGLWHSPIEYKVKSLVHALQWAIGLEWYLPSRRSLARGDEHRPSQRRIVSGLS